jgi:SRSO17 transposase
MTTEELDTWAADFAAFHARFAHLFGRSEPREQAVKYLRALLTPVERKNGWQMAEAIGDRTPDATQRLLYQAQWDADAARDLLQAVVCETLGDTEGIGVVDETGFIKKGIRSVGVQRQYSGTAGKIENCQLGVFLSYATSAGHALLDRRLYLPAGWCADPVRRVQAKVPEGVSFQTKPELAVAMLQHAWAQGVAMRWVTGDEIYGESLALRDTVAASGRWYVLGVRTNLLVWSAPPAVVLPAPAPPGRPGTQVRLSDDAPPACLLAELVAAWPEDRWQRLAVTEGEKGAITYDWACQRVIESRQQLPGPEVWLLARRSLSAPHEIAYYLSNAPADTPLPKLAHVASTRYTVEQCIEEGKGETGLDDYEVRYWHSWYRHITLSMMAHTWLVSVRRKAATQNAGSEPFLAELTVPEVRRLLDVALPLPPHSPELRLAWSDWRRAKRQQARRSHYRHQAMLASPAVQPRGISP